MSLRFGPRNPASLNLYHQGNLVISESSQPFIHADVDKAAKTLLVAEYIKETFALDASPTLDQCVITDTTEWYQFNTHYFLFIRN